MLMEHLLFCYIFGTSLECVTLNDGSSGFKIQDVVHENFWVRCMAKDTVWKRGVSETWGILHYC